MGGHKKRSGLQEQNENGQGGTTAFTQKCQAPGHAEQMTDWMARMLEGGAASRQDTWVTSSTGSEMKGWGPQLGPWRLRETGSGSHYRLRVGNQDTQERWRASKRGGAAGCR